MSQMELQRQWSDQQKRQRRQKRQPVSRFHGFYFEDTFERRQNERTRNQSGDVRIQDDEDTPLQFYLIGVHVAFDGMQNGFHASLLIAPIRPDSYRTLWPRSPSEASAPARCAFAGIRGPDPWGFSNRPARGPA